MNVWWKGMWNRTTTVTTQIRIVNELYDTAGEVILIRVIVLCTDHV